MRIIKLTLGWIIGVMSYEFVKSQWLNVGMDWQGILDFCVGGFVEYLLGLGLGASLKK